MSRGHAHPIRAGLVDGECKGESEISPFALMGSGERGKLARSQFNRDEVDQGVGARRP